MNVNHYRSIFTLCFWIISFAATAQSGKLVSGRVVDAGQGEALPGVTVLLKGTSTGVMTDADGNFEIKIPQNTGTLVFSSIGFQQKEVEFTSTGNMGTISLRADAQALEEVVVVGVADIARDRETPVAVSTIKSREIQEKLGSQEFPEILRSTPSVYVTKQGGGFGDSRVNIRGFDQSNTAVMINGMPINDMENGWVYWSNWAGLSDVTTAMQVQRGLGSSKLAISSVGGTINVLTRAADMEQGGLVSASVGNGGYLKTLASYNTGKMANGLSVSALFSRTAGDDRYAYGTSFEGYNYFLALGYQPNDDHDLQLTITGAPQSHNQRGYAPPIADYIRFGNSEDPDIKYNSDWGYRNGEEATFSGNFYHKPIASLNWEWNISHSSRLSTVLYNSFGRGGSVGSIGRINGGQSFYGQFKDDKGRVRIDDIIAWNTGSNIADFGDTREGYTGAGEPAYQGMYINGGDYASTHIDGADDAHINGTENGISQRSSVNSHNWFGIIANFHNDVNENWSFDAGVDLRTYKGIHYRRLVDLLGADAYVDNDNINAPYRFITSTYSPSVSNTWNVFRNTDDEVKIDYYNDGKVNWAGAFGQLEYKNEVISAFIQGAISNQGFQRIDYFNYLDSDPEQESDWQNFLGGNIKGGLNYNIDERHNVFFNAGYYSKQPKFDAVFIDYNSNTVNEEVTNEQIIGLELGYGFRSRYLDANLNLYRTSWKDRFEDVSANFTVNPDNPDDIIRGTANMQGIEQVHAGLEIDFVARPVDRLAINGMFSYGDWQYGSDVTGRAFDQSNNYLGDIQLYLDGVKVGDAAQLTSRLGFEYEIIDRLRFDASWDHIDQLYALIDVTSFTDPNHQGSLELPAYDLFDAGLSYSLPLSKTLRRQSLSIRVNVNNVFDEVYISEAATNYHVREDDETWRGLSTGNRVFFGLGRTWNASLRYRF